MTAPAKFADTQPLPREPRAPVPSRRWWRRQPNYLPVGERVWYGLLAVTWMAWAAIGMVSGHMFFLVSRRAPAHFSGLPALIFAGAVLASAAACACKFIDHYDQRDNEEQYRRAKKILWCGAGVLFLLAVLVGVAERNSLLPYTDGRWGLLGPDRLRMLLASTWLAGKLQPHAEQLHAWSFVAVAWFAGAGLLLKRMGVMDGRPGHVTRNGITLAVLLLPALTTITLGLLADLSAGDVARKAGLAEDQVRAQVAWVLSMLVVCAAAWAMVSAMFVLVVLRGLGVLPSLQEEQAKKNGPESVSSDPGAR